MTWTSVLPETLAAVLMIILPGCCTLFSWRLRPLVTISAAAPVSVAIFAISAFGAQLSGTTWSVFWVLGVTLVLVLFGFMPRLIGYGRGLFEWRQAEEWKTLAAYLLGAAIGAVFFLPLLLHSLISPNHFAQRYDNALHLNAIQMVARGDGASPTEFSAVGAGNFYPAGWHEWAGLVAQLTSGDPIRATQACTLVSLCLIWPLALIWLYEALFEARVLGRTMLGAISLAWTQLTFGMLYWGTLYPNLFAFTLSPVVLAAGWEVLKIRKQRTISSGQAVAVFAFASFGVTTAHPNAIFTVFAMLVIPALWTVIRPLRARRAAGGVLRSVVLRLSTLIAVAAFGYLWLRTGSSLRNFWQPEMAFGEAIVEALLGVVLNQMFVPVLTGLLVLGTLALLIKPRCWLIIFSYLTVVMIYAISAGMADGPLRQFFGGLYYNDYRRPAAAIAILLIPIAAYGAQSLVSLIGVVIKWRPHWLIALVLSLVCCVPASYYAANNDQFREQVKWTFMAFELNEGSDILTPDEYELVKRIPQHVPADEKVVVNPWNGGGLVYAIADRVPTTFYLNNARTSGAKTINMGLENASENPDVCDALNQDKARYVLELEPHYISNGYENDRYYSGLDEIAERPGFEVVDSQGEAKLYKITACQ